MSRQLHASHRGIDATIFYGREKSTVHVVKGAARIARKYYSGASVRPFYDEKGREPKIRFKDYTGCWCGIAIDYMTIEDLCSLLNVHRDLDIKYASMFEPDSIKIINNPIAIEYSIHQKSPKEFHVEILIGKTSSGFVRKISRPYVTVGMRPASHENRHRLNQLVAELERI